MVRSVAIICARGGWLSSGCVLFGFIRLVIRFMCHCYAAEFYLLFSTLRCFFHMFVTGRLLTLVQMLPTCDLSLSKFQLLIWSLPKMNYAILSMWAKFKASGAIFRIGHVFPKDMCGAYYASLATVSLMLAEKSQRYGSVLMRSCLQNLYPKNRL